MAKYKPKVKETTEDRLQKAINLGRKETLKEVLEWLKKHTYSIHYRKEHCNFGINFESEEEMIQTFKKQFNIK